jgi:hypothetical protein
MNTWLKILAAALIVVCCYGPLISMVREQARLRDQLHLLTDLSAAHAARQANLQRQLDIRWEHVVSAEERLRTAEISLRTTDSPGRTMLKRLLQKKR